MLLPRRSSFQIKNVIAKSIKASWIKKSDNNGNIWYEREYKRPISLYKIFTTGNFNTYLSNSKNATTFFAKNNAIYVKRYNTLKAEIVSLYDYKSNIYYLLGVDYSHIEHVTTVEEYVKTPNGEICLLYHAEDLASVEGKRKIGIYNFSKRKIIYEVENKKIRIISLPLANSVSIILRTRDSKGIIYIETLNLLNGDKYEISCLIKDYLRSLVIDYANSALSTVTIEEYRNQAENLIEGLRIVPPTVSEEINMLKVYYKNYTPDVTLDKNVFYKSFTIGIDVKYEIKNEEYSLKMYHTLILCCSMEEDELSIILRSEEEGYLIIESKITKIPNIIINPPSQVLLRETYKIKMYGNFAKSCLYRVTDLFDNYLIIGITIWKLNLSNHDKAHDNSKHNSLIDMLQFSNLDIYETLIDGSKRFFLRFKTKSFEELCKINRYVVHNSTKEVKILDLSRLCDVLTKSQHDLDLNSKQHIDVTEYVISVDASPLTDSSQAHRVCKGLVHKHKMYFNNVDNKLYLFLSLTNYNPSTKEFTVCIPVYRYNFSNYGAKWVNVMTLGPYTYSLQDTYSPRKIPTNKLLPLITNDIIKNGYNMLAYSDLLVNLIEENNETDNVFLSMDNIKFKFEDSYIEITDIVYNRRIVFIDNAYDQRRLPSHIKQEDKVLVFLEHPDNTKMSYKPFIISEMELVKSIPYHT